MVWPCERLARCGKVFGVPMRGYRGEDGRDLGDDRARDDRAGKGPSLFRNVPRTTVGIAMLMREARRSAQRAAAVTVDDIATAVVEARGAGEAVDEAVRTRTEGHLGADLTGVRVHSDELSREGTAAMGARAFAYGKDVFLGPGERGTDVELMAHELTHVWQQGAAAARTAQRQVQVGATGSPAEQQADQVASAVAAGPPEGQRIVDGAATGPGQMSKVEFLALLHTQVTATATAALGWLGSAMGCPYIEAWFAKHANSDARTLEGLARKYSGLTSPQHARDYLPPILARLRQGIERWQYGGDVTGDLGAAGLGAAAAAVPAAPGGDKAHAKPGAAGLTPASLVAELGPAERLDATTAARMGGALDADLSRVRIHTGPEAQAKATELRAHAFAVGEHVAFAPGRYEPGTPHGDALLAHELAHVSQQQGSGPAAQNTAPLGNESPAHEDDADQAATGALARLWGKATGWASKAAGRARATMTSGMQLQRCSSDSTPDFGHVASADAKGQMQGADVGFVPNYGGPTAIKAGRTLGTFKTSAAAIAAIRANGRGGAVTAEDGMFVAYEVLAAIPDSGWSSTDQPAPTTVAPGVTALITSDGTVLRPGAADPLTTPRGEVRAEDRSKDTGDPYQAYADAFGDGKSLNNADDNQILVAFEAAMKDTAITVLARSEEEVRTKKETFDKGTGTGGVSKDELATMRQTAADLWPVVNELSYNQAVVDQGMRDMSPSIPVMTGNSPPPMPALPMYSGDEIAAAMEKVRILTARRAAVIGRWPMIARIPETELVAFSKKTDEEMVARMGGEMPGILEDIASTRANVLSGELDLWELDSVVNATIAGLGIKDEQKRKVVLDRKKEKAHAKTVSQIVRSIFAVGFGLAAAFLTGGASLAFAAGAFGLGLYDAINQTNEYIDKKAAANTNIDPNATLLPKELVPSWGWLVVAWVGVGLDAQQVAASVKAIGAAEKVLSNEAIALAKANYKKLGFASAEALEARLKSAAGIIETEKAVTEASRAAVASKVGTSIEIKAGLPAGQIEVHYVVEGGRVRVIGMKVAEGASVADVLAHAEVVRLLKRYEGVTGRVREVWDRLLSLAGKASADANPFPPGSKAFESWLEMKKLPGMIEARTQRLGSAVGTAKEAELRADVEFLENELAHHTAVVDTLQLEKGSGFVAAYGDATRSAAKQGRYLPDVAPGVELTDDVLKTSGYYYKQVNGELQLVRKEAAVGKSLTPVVGPDGRQVIENGVPKFIENVNDLTRAEKAAELVKGFPAEKQAAYEAFKTSQEAAGNIVVPVKGIYSTGKTFKQVTKGTAFRDDLIAILRKALVKSGKDEATAATLAGEAADRLLAKEITVVQGTDQLRAFGYQRNYIKATQTAADDLEDLHHLVPLYLGGDHTVGNLINIDKTLHGDLHDLIDKVKFSDDFSLAPHSMQNMNVSFSPGVAVIQPNGSTQLMTLSQLPAPQ